MILKEFNTVFACGVNGSSSTNSLILIFIETFTSTKFPVMFRINQKGGNGKKMETRIDARIDEYVKAFNELSGVVGEDVAVRILDNLGKDRRCETIDRNTKNKVTVKNPDDPASEKQKKLLKKLGVKYDSDVNKGEASSLIDDALQNSED